MKRRWKQQEFSFRSWGGARKGAGRKTTGPRRLSHRTREDFKARFPVHVTLKIRKGLPTLRSKAVRNLLLEKFRAGALRRGFRLVHYSVQGDHVHLIVEAANRACLASGIQALCTRMARGLNRLWKRSGAVFADRYHDRVLRSPTQVRHALCYVLNNARKHGLKLSKALDPFASGFWFDGWREKLHIKNLEPVLKPIATATTWLLSKGWRRGRFGLISTLEVPG